MIFLDTEQLPNGLGHSDVLVRIEGTTANDTVTGTKDSGYILSSRAMIAYVVRVATFGQMLAAVMTPQTSLANRVNLSSAQNPI